MSIGNENEITVRVKCSLKELKEILLRDGFQEVHIYNAKDTFLIPKSINVKTEDTRFILSKAVLLRESNGLNVEKHRERITFKSKEFASDGSIISQYSVNCDVMKIDDAKQLFEHLGYKELMTISEQHFSYRKEQFKLVIKCINDNNILIEAETNEKYKTIDELKEAINNTQIPFDKSNYFVKKAEEILEDIKKGR